MSDVLHIRLGLEVLEALDVRAEAESRTRSAMARKILVDALDEEAKPVPKRAVVGVKVSTPSVDRFPYARGAVAMPEVDPGQSSVETAQQKAQREYIEKMEKRK